jgi:hypothetical protein
MAIAYPTDEGARVLAMSLPPDVLKRLTDGYPARAGVTGGRALLLDGRNTIIATTGTDSVANR